MTHHRLSAYAGPKSWENFPWTAFGPGRWRAALLPVFGFGAAPAGLPLDFEEVLGSAVLAEARQAMRGAVLMPPLRFAHTPHPSAALDLRFSESAQIVREIADAVKRAGIERLIVLATSPWQREWLADLCRDIRADLGIRTYIIPLAGIDLDLHPRALNRDATLAAVAALCGVTLSPSSIGKESVVRLRPGDVRLLPDATAVPDIDPARIVTDAAKLLAQIVAEIIDPATAGKPVALLASPRDIALPQGKLRSRALFSMTEAAIDAIPAKGDACVVIATGAIEQHGPHLPVSVDALLGQAYLEAAAERLPAAANVWFGLPITFGKSTEHRAWAGTVGVSAESLRAMVRAQVHALRRRGFRRFAFLNTHGGNSATLIALSRELEAEGAGEVGMLTGLYKPELTSPQDTAYGYHAGDWETSLMLAVDATPVDMTKAVCEYPARIDEVGVVRPEGGRAQQCWVTEDVSRSGVMGDATIATAEKGRAWFEEYVRVLVGRIEEWAESRNGE